MRWTKSLTPYAATIAALCFAGALTVFLAFPANAQSDEACPDPTPTAVEVDAVPIVVSSTTADYFVLYAKHEVNGTDVDIPVLVKRGESDTTTLAENVEALPIERYRVEKYLVSDPADIDGDCIDDIAELDNLGSMNPVNPAAAIESSDGMVAIPDQATFEALSFDTLGESFVKFVLFGMDTAQPSVYFINTKTHTKHESFLDAVGLQRGPLTAMVVREVTFDSELVAPDGSPGVYRYWLRFNNSFNFVARSYTTLAAGMPLLDDNLAFHLSNPDLLQTQPELPLYEDSRINVVFDADIAPESDFISMNPTEGYGFLRVMDLNDRPNPRDIVIYEALPNELPHVAGIITTVPQTPLSHVNLRAVQDGVPNAVIRGAIDNPEIAPLIGSYVHYTVIERGYVIRAATKEEVDDHYASSRPAQPQTPQRDLSVTEITPLSDIGFDRWDAFGVKAANVAVLGTLDFPEGTVPDGFAIPFYFYDEFMKHNNFNTRIQAMLNDADFQGSLSTQEEELKQLRKDIEDAETPQWIIDALVTMNEGFPEGINRRYRSSTNNEDLPGFNGAGLYDSKSQKPKEDEEDLAKSLKEVYASLWNFRAFIERDFHRVDHMAAAMGVLVHPSYQDELVNGVAVSFDPIYGEDDAYYVNSQIGEDLVTNPAALSVPEEIVVHELGAYILVVATSNQVTPGQLTMSSAHLHQLRRHLKVIHDHFKKLYNPAPDEQFAMEIEFKITSEGILAIKQARPWFFGDAPLLEAPGTVTLSPTQPRVDVTLTATLKDINRVLNTPTWQWQRSPNGTDSWSLIVGATSSSYTPTASDTGDYLRAMGSYTDGLGPNKSAMVVSATPVRDGSPPPPPPPPPPEPPPPVTGGGGGGGFGPAPVAPSFVDGFRTERAVAENARAGDAVGDPVSATHLDELEISYSLNGTDAAFFTVDEETGQITVKEGMDLIVGRTYTVNLTATDSVGFGAIIIVVIEVTEASFSPYDRNGNGRIERDEVIMAVADYFRGAIDKEEVIELVKLYFSGSD